MGASQRPPPQSMRSSMRPPPRPVATQQSSFFGRAASPAESITSNSGPVTGTKRKERDFDQDVAEETNIHVVVRCRGRSDREVRENSGVVVSTNGAKGKTVELSMGPSAISNKTYQFDKVFSPAADQAIIYDDVVAPILSEMLAGYNCTIFAYGQTGTGKTYTMSGDMTDTLGLLSDNAGIIPRVLYSLFQKLESDDIECSIKCSFIELYNEELRDLLSPDDNVKLKIYDDANRKSHSATLVQGMEESHIKSATAGIKLLQEGSLRRQVAATKCNDLSSRSHTVFTITTYIKKVNDNGEDFICSGKLNLVDLAGSENIQRSGAENKRAAEAGLINKSLLTLGRVINALVDKGSHIPYRESKLTRLLQDSLGGRTKTCIIATVSPAKSNLEETISTLDYAFRAKNIRNKPQVNSMISKKTLLKEFTTEIEKLKSELFATRQRNGVYLSNDQYEEITVESESRRILGEEQKSRIETMEASLRNKVQDLFNLTNNFTQLKRDNESTRTALENTKDVLRKTEIVLRDTKQNLTEESALREAHETTEAKLLDMGAGLISTLDDSVKDVNALQAKLKRRSMLHSENQQVWQSSITHLKDVSAAFDSRFLNFEKTHADLIASASNRIQFFVESESKTLAECGLSLTSKADELEDKQTNAEAHFSDAREDMNNVLEEIKVLREHVKDKVGQGLQGLSQAAERISGEVISELEQFHTQLHTSYSTLGKDFKSMFEEMLKQLAAQREESDRLREALEQANTKNLEATRTASVQLESYLEAERASSIGEREQLKSQIFALIEASATDRDRRLASNMGKTQVHLSQSKRAFEEADHTFREDMDKWGIQDNALLEKVTRSKEDLKARMKTDWMAVNTRNSSIQTSTKAVHEETVKIVDAQLKEMATQMEALDEFVTRARSQNDTHHQEHVRTSKELSSHIQETLASLREDFAKRDDGLKTIATQSQVGIGGLQSLVSTFSDETRQSAQNLKSEVFRTVLVDYLPTGETPQKKDWTYPTELPRTEDHQAMLARLRGFSEQPPPKKTPSTSRIIGRSPKKQISPYKPVSPSKSPSKSQSPKKAKVYTDSVKPEENNTILPPTTTAHAHPDHTGNEALKGLKEIDMNVITRPASANEVDTRPIFSKSLGTGQPPLKRHATANAVVDSKLLTKTGKGKGGGITLGLENFGQSLGTGRRLRSSPHE